MLLTIFNLPMKTRYSDIKLLLHSNCGFKDIILDNLTNDGNSSKKVTVGLAEEEDAAILVRKINGMYVDGHRLHVETLKKKQPANQDDLYNQQSGSRFGSRTQMQSKPEASAPATALQPNLQQPYYQQNSFQQPTYPMGYTDNMGMPMVSASMAYASMYGVSTNQNALTSYGYPQQMQYQSTSQIMPPSLLSLDQGQGAAPLGFNDQGNDSSSWSNVNNWNSAGNASAENKSNQKGSRWGENHGESGSRSNRDGNLRERRDAHPRDYERDQSSRDFGRNAQSRDFRQLESQRSFGRDAPSRDRGRDASTRNYGWEAPSRDRGRNAPGHERDRDAHGPDFGPDASSRNFGRDAPGQNFGRDMSGYDFGRNTSGRDFGRDAPVRDFNREAPGRTFGRDAPGRTFGRDAGGRDFGRNELDRNPERNAPPSRIDRGPNINPKPPTFSTPNSNSKIYGQHVTDPSPQINKFSQQKIGNKRPQPEQKLPTPKPKKEHSNYVPPSKRSRFENQFSASKSDVPATQPQKPGKKKNKSKNNPELYPVRSATWRAQVASSLAKEMLGTAKLKTDIVLERLLTDLKRRIRDRLQELIGEDYEVKMVDMTKIYRDKYATSTDAALVNEVIEEIKKNESSLEGEKKPGDPEGEQVKKNEENHPLQETKQPTAQKILPVKKTQKNIPKNLPSYPQGDKKLFKEQKKINETMFKDEDSLLSQLKPAMQQALEEEVAEMCKLILEKIQGEEPTPEYKPFYEKVITTVVDDLKKVLKINIAKRFLNVGPILLRIFNSPKIMSRGKLAPILSTHGVTSLKKSDKKPMYIGTCASYKVQDKLCSRKPLVIDGITITFKPFQLAGQKEKLGREQYKKQRQNMMQRFANIYDDEEEQEQGDFDDYDDGDDADVLIAGEDVVNEPVEWNENEQGNGGQKTVKQENESNNVPKEQQESKENEAKNETKEPSELEYKNNDKVDDTDEFVIKVEINPQENDPAKTVDFKEDVVLESDNNNKDAFDGGKGSSENTEHAIDEKINKEKEEDLQDFAVHNPTIDDIDIADLNDDDLEDWC